MDDKLGLFAGSGELPVKVAQNALNKGMDLYVYALDRRNIALLKQLIAPERIRFIRNPGLLNRNVELVRRDGIKQAVFAGKVSKWILLRAPLLDSRALGLWKEQSLFNDDSIMLTIIREFEKEGIEIVRQADFIQDLFIKEGLYSSREPDDTEIKDIKYGLSLAKEMGRLDIGQTVVISRGMVLAIEAIEGTDQAIMRAGQWNGKKGGVVVKVEKPCQDLRFDLPTVGPGTLKSMKKVGLKVLAVEAGKTLALELETMIRLANKWQMTLVAV